MRYRVILIHGDYLLSIILFFHVKQKEAVVVAAAVHKSRLPVLLDATATATMIIVLKGLD